MSNKDQIQINTNLFIKGGQATVVIQSPDSDLGVEHCIRGILTVLSQFGVQNKVPIIDMLQCAGHQIKEIYKAHNVSGIQLVQP